MSAQAIAIDLEKCLTPAHARDSFMDALSRILASQTFSKSARLSAFLRYVCTAALEGRASILSEQHIGTAVFGRPDHYNAAEDTIVRSSARLLRQRLALYYEGEGLRDQFRISIPRGAYVPVFVPTTPDAGAVVADVPAPARTIPAVEDLAAPVAVTAPLPAELALPPAPAAVTTRHPRWPCALMWLLPLLVMIIGLAAWYGLARSTTAPGSASRFWAAMLPADRDTLLVVADNGLVMYQGDSGRKVGLDDYLANRFGGADQPDEAQRLLNYRARRYTAMSSVTVAVEVAKLASAAPERLHVRLARDLQLADLKHANTILVGAEQSNPWWELFRKQFNFHIDWDPGSRNFQILNDKPATGEQATYAFSSQDPKKRGFAIVGYKRNLGGTGHTLFIGGTTSAGTEAGMEFLLRPAFMDPLMRQALRPDGTVREFEVLIQCVLQANGNTDIQLLGVRVKAD